MSETIKTDFTIGTEMYLDKDGKIKCRPLTANDVPVEILSQMLGTKIETRFFNPPHLDVELTGGRIGYFADGDLPKLESDVKEQIRAGFEDHFSEVLPEFQIYDTLGAGPNGDLSRQALVRLTFGTPPTGFSSENVLAVAFYPFNGRSLIFMNPAQDWNQHPRLVEYVVCHEFGHSLGFPHVSNLSFIMGPFIQPTRPEKPIGPETRATARERYKGLIPNLGNQDLPSKILEIGQMAAFVFKSYDSFTQVFSGYELNILGAVLGYRREGRTDEKYRLFLWNNVIAQVEKQT